MTTASRRALRIGRRSPNASVKSTARAIGDTQSRRTRCLAVSTRTGRAHHSALGSTTGERVAPAPCQGVGCKRSHRAEAKRPSFSCVRSNGATFVLMTPPALGCSSSHIAKAGASGQGILRECPWQAKAAQRLRRFGTCSAPRELDGRAWSAMRAPNVPERWIDGEVPRRDSWPALGRADPRFSFAPPVGHQAAARATADAQPSPDRAQLEREERAMA
jgi:hypothetical protein